jgi:hypothetical protein
VLGGCCGEKTSQNDEGKKTPLQLLAPAKAASAVELDRGIDEERSLLITDQRGK